MKALKRHNPIDDVGLDIEWAVEGWPEEISITALSLVLARCIVNSKNYVNSFDLSSKIIIDSLKVLSEQKHDN